MKNKRHSVGTSRWGSPRPVLEASRSILANVNGILDPATDKRLNELGLNTPYYFTAHEDGLRQPWTIRKARPLVYPDRTVFTVTHTQAAVFLNPPTGAKEWWNKLLSEIDKGHVSHALFLSYSIENFQTTQKETPRPILAYPTVVFSSRLAFTDGITGQPKKGMTHSSAITYVPGAIDQTCEFYKQFSPFGWAIQSASSVTNFCNSGSGVAYTYI